MWYIYLIRNQQKNYQYIGITQNPEERLKKHNEGATKSTRPYRPFTQMIILEKCKDRITARKREKYYKSGAGREKIRGLAQLASAHAWGA